MTPTPRPRFDVRNMPKTCEVCPGCGAILPHRQCHMTYSTWHCWGCGGRIDGRVASPLLGIVCENTWPGYERGFFDPAHPIACSCSGRGYYLTDEVDFVEKL